MHQKTQRLLKITLLAVLAIGVGGVSWWLLRGPGRPSHDERSTTRDRSPLGNASSRPDAPNTAGGIAGIDPVPVPSLIGSIVENERKRASTAEDLVRKGLPLIPNGRKACLEFTAGKSLEDLADNLGDIGVMEKCRNGNVWGMGSGMAFWATALPPNTMILRLIEEGRQDPDRVSAILEKAIAKKIGHLAEIREKQQLALKAVGGNAVDNVYQDALPTQFSIVGAFYVLANIGRLNNPALLQSWIASPKPAGYEAVEMGTWLIDYYFRLADGSRSQGAGVHLAIANNRAPTGPKQAFSKWNQPWDIHDRILLAKGVNAKDIQTIEVLSIPSEDPFTFKETIQIQENFSQHVRQLRPADDPAPTGH